ncbi:hypothetical protein [Orgyia leucostigma nucleopolyhedrovirus]|uniref:Uncharacterized protein n=1 Tax=Orgyia leucostigma nucleopolyhedrovirus TaxID=490711 RepID=B0FDS7_9ABAC|nr:hypothetical protein [Orgyia leucostigma nucleopolyhedrovirus]ABY65785.1 hypothetical protein [Orgyia leucostigma nucleopolyhedrovirus]
MNRRFFLNVVICDGARVFKLLAGINEPLLVGRNSFFFLYFLLYNLHCITGVHFYSYGLAGQSFYENLHFNNDTLNWSSYY